MAQVLKKEKREETAMEMTTRKLKDMGISFTKFSMAPLEVSGDHSKSSSESHKKSHGKKVKSEKQNGKSRSKKKKQQDRDQEKQEQAETSDENS